MGGCYRDYEAERREAQRSEWRRSLRQMLSSNDRLGLTTAYKEFFKNGNGAFIREVACANGISNVTNLPKEFPQWEYEFKFDVGLVGKGREPESVKEYLNAFDFPVLRDSRFLRDPINTEATGINRFYGTGSEERLVVITKCSKSYLKEKGNVQPLQIGVPYEHMIVKRLEDRYEADVDKIANRMSEVVADGSRYVGRIRKEKGDDFILDADTGRIYSFTITRAHLVRPGEEKESDIQRQLEIEYAGYVPGFKAFRKDSEPQLVSGLIDLAKYTFNLNRQTQLSKDLSFTLWPTLERKYDFVCGLGIAQKERKQLQLFDGEKLDFRVNVKQGARLLERARAASSN